MLYQYTLRMSRKIKVLAIWLRRRGQNKNKKIKKLNSTSFIINLSYYKCIKLIYYIFP